MKIRTMDLNQFRNYGELSLEFDPGINIFYGDNAQGKTNILEAVYLCGTNKSHRGSRDREMIRFGEEEAHIRMMVERRETLRRIDIHLKKNKAKGIAVDGLPLRKASELFGIVNVVFFSPEDLQIIKNGPAERRRFVDLELCQLDKIYLYELVNYNKALMQRNLLLREIPWKPDLLDTLERGDEQLARFGSRIVRLRSRFIAELGDMILRIHRGLSGGREELKILYEPDCGEDEILEKLSSGRQRDLKQKTTMSGPHRDDISFSVNGVDIRRFGSQGQQRTAALALKMAEIELVRKVTEDEPVLLLDDVLSELDENRQTQLLNSIDGIQTMITCTGLDDFVNHRFHMDKIFRVSEGTVKKEN